jgi:hypothetical protein
MRRRACSVGLAACLFLGSAAPGFPARVVVYGPRTPQAEAAVIAAISTIDGVEVLSGDPVREGHPAERPGASVFARQEWARHLRADLLLLLGPRGDSFGYVEGPTGEELFRIREHSPDALAASARLLVEELRDAERLARWQVAVLDDAATAREAAQLREGLRAQGLRVLDRSLIPRPAWPALPAPRTLCIRLAREPGGIRLHILRPLPGSTFSPDPVDPEALTDTVTTILQIAVRTKNRHHPHDWP